MNSQITKGTCVNDESSLTCSTNNGLVNETQRFISHSDGNVQEIIRILESRLPCSAHVYNMAKMYQRFYPQIKVYSLYGVLTSESIILLTTIREDYGQDITISIPMDFIPTDEIKLAFASTQAINWDDAYWFCAVDRLVSPMILEISALLKGNSTQFFPDFYFVMDVQKALSLDIKLQENTEIRSLNSEEGVDFLVKQWAYSKDGTAEYTKQIVEKNPSSGLYLKDSKDNKVLSGIVANSHGLVGSLSTLPEERQKGYAVNVLQHLLKSLASDGFFPASCVEQKNIASANFHKKVGMRVSHYCDDIIYLNNAF